MHPTVTTIYKINIGKLLSNSVMAQRHFSEIGLNPIINTIILMRQVLDYYGIYFAVLEDFMT